MIDPSDGAPFAAIARGSAADIDAAVQAAQAAFEGAWGRLAPAEKGRALARVSAAIAAHAEELALIEARDCGKPLKQARADVAACARYFEFYAGAPDKLHGETIPYADDYTVLTWREPHGVTGHIIPWNYPLQIFGRSVGAALAAGNACVVKPAEDACLSLLRVAQLAADAGLAGRRAEHRHRTRRGGGRGARRASRHRAPVVHRLACDRTARREGVRGATLPGHAGARRQGAADRLRRRRYRRRVAGPRQRDRAERRADVQRRLAPARRGVAATRRCSEGSRERFAALRTGPALADLDCGPLIRASQRDRVRGFLDGARRDGIAIAAQGTIADDAPSDGFYVAPTLLRDVPAGHRLACEEVFGPVLSAMPFDDEADAVRLANGTDFGLVAGVWTRDGARQLRMARAIRAGRCSSTTTVRAAASSCRSAASSIRGTAARRASRRCTASRR